MNLRLRVARRRKRARARDKALKIVILATVFAISAGIAFHHENTTSNTEYTVKSGDTLFGIAERFCGDTYVLEFKDDIVKANDLESEQIHVGQVIKIPTKGDETK